MRLTKSRGFTLVELVVVIAIVSIMMAMAVPALQAFARRNQASLIYRQVTQVLRLAQQWAVFHQTPSVVYFDLDRGTYWFEEGVDDGYSNDRVRKRELTRLPKHYKFTRIIFHELGDEYSPDDTESGEEYDYGETQLTFYPNGTATPITLELVWTPIRQKGKKFSFSVNHYSGKVAFKEKQLGEEDSNGY